MKLGSGEGGCWLDRNWSTAGSGGIAGQGGIIKYSSTSIISAYNGNRITEDDFDYSKTYYDYDNNGNYLDGTGGKDRKIAEVIEFKNESNKKIIPAKIFIQDGIRRAVYDNHCYMSEARKKQNGVDGEIPANKIKNVSKGNTLKNVRIIDEKLDMPYSKQGIGSGAGYIEISNGTFEQITTP